LQVTRKARKGNLDDGGEIGEMPEFFCRFAVKRPISSPSVTVG